MLQNLEQALANPRRSKREAVKQVRAYLLGHKKPWPQSIQQLRNNFYHLRVAAEKVYGREPKDALPNKVSSEYRRRSSVRSRADQVFEEEERLS